MLNRNSPVPLYFQLQEIIRERIESGQWVEGDQLPTEQELMRMYGVSRIVVNQALNNLVREGLIERHRGRGTFVAHAKTSMNQLESWFGSYEDLLKQGYVPVTKVIEQAVQPAKEPFTRYLAVREGEPLLYLHRLRLRQGSPDEPLALMKTHIVLHRAPGLETQSFENASLYRLLDQLGIHIAAHRRIIDAIPAGRFEAKTLGIAGGMPLIRFRNISYLQNGIPLEYFVTLYRADRIQFELGLTRRPDEELAIAFYRESMPGQPVDLASDLQTIFHK